MSRISKQHACSGWHYRTVYAREHFTTTGLHFSTSFSEGAVTCPETVGVLPAAYLCLAGCACFNLIIMVAFFAFGGYVGYIFTDDPTVVKIVAKLSILAGLYQVHGYLLAVCRDSRF
jgi:hypothetical protein